MIVKNKYNGETIAELEDTTLEKAKEIKRLSVESSRKMKSLLPYEREEILLEISRKIRDDNGKLAKIIAQEAGKPVRYSRKEAGRAATTFKIAAEESTRAEGEVIPLGIEPRGRNRFAYYVREPIGVVFSITPFNDPLNLVAHKIAPALASGNAIINKPSSLTPLSCLNVLSYAEDTSLPKNSVAAVLASGGGAVTDFLVTSPDIKMVSFTGGFEAAQRLVQKAGVKKYGMELGSNSPVIVWGDADLDLAAEAVCDAAFESQGQNCIHAQRIFIQRESYDYFKNRLIGFTEKLVIGDPLLEETDVGPMISKGSADRVMKLIEDAVGDGANILHGFQRNGNLVTPTILENVKHSSEIWTEEIFGPVVLLEPVDSFKKAIELANSVEYGLQAGVFTSDLNLALMAIENLEYGAVLINDTSDFRVDSMPFGGFKRSGIGREGIRFSMEEMSEIKLAIFKR
ncbi:MAG: aldehyde dehydrogenase family protein [Thermoplasmataceae archaeon]